MKVQHYILIAVFFFGLSLLDALIPIDLNTLLISFIIVYLLHAINEAKEREAREKWDNIIKMMKDDDQQNS